ncbi:Intraflagellar transport protein 88 [Sorochytrium milnesiophthora]
MYAYMTPQTANRPETGMRSMYAPGTAAGRSLKTAAGASGGAGARMGTARAGSAFGSNNNSNRPMSSMRAAGFSSRGRTGVLQTSAFDPLKIAAAKPQDAKAEPTPEEQVKTAERKILQLIHDCSFLREEGQYQKALDRAKEAGKRERQLNKQREQLGLAETTNLDLTYCVLVNLADQYFHVKMYQEAINTYNIIVKNKLFNQSGRLRVNIGNIYFEMKKYPQAIKMYRMALDQIPQTNRDIRLKILRNIGSAFVITGQFQDAITSYETIMESNPDHQTAFNLLLCYFALGLRDKMRKGFQRMASLRPVAVEQTEDNLPFSVSRGSARETDFGRGASRAHNHLSSAHSAPYSASTLHGRGSAGPGYHRHDTAASGASSSGTKRGNTADDMDMENELIADHHVFTQDNLRALAIHRKKANDRYLMMAAKLIAPTVDASLGSGWDWLIEVVKGSPAADSASELEVSKALSYLKLKEFNQAQTHGSFERKDQKMMATVATNLSFLYFLEDEVSEASRYADLAITADRYNAKAMTNKGNCYYAQGDFDKARDCFDEAINMDALCTEAVFNLGLAHKQTGDLHEALRHFEKLHAILRGNAEVIYHIADIYEKIGSIQQALEWYSILVSLVPTDPAVLSRIAMLHMRDNDKAQAFHYFSESYRYYPADIDVISWLGSYYIDCEVYEQALQFFERAALVQPSEIKWQLMIASCLRRSGNHQLSFDVYKKVHEQWPDNIECLKYMVRIATDLGIKEVPEYTAKLTKAERNEAEKGSKETRLPYGARRLGKLSYQAQTTVWRQVEVASSPAAEDKVATAAKKSDAEEWDEDVGSMLPD